MTIRITTRVEPNRTIVKVVGRLQRDDFDELVRIVAELGSFVALDLTELQSVDRVVATQLREFVRRGVEVCAASPYVKLLLESEPEQ